MSKSQCLSVGAEEVVTTFATVCTSSFPQPLLASSFPVLLPTLQYTPLATYDPGTQSHHQGITFQALTSSFPPPGYPLISSQGNLLSPSTFLPHAPAPSQPKIRPANKETTHTIQAPPVPVDDESSEDEDLHLCGACKGQFQSYTAFTSHKKTCAARKQKSRRNDASNKGSEGGGTQGQSTGQSQGGNREVNNPTLEANAISLLANQFGEGVAEQEDGKGKQQEMVRWRVAKEQEKKEEGHEGVKWQVAKVQEGKGEQQEMVRWQVEETTELGSEAGDDGGSLLCISVDQGPGQAVQYQPIQSLSLSSPSPSMLSSIPNIQIQECTINFSLAEPSLALEQDLVISQQQQSPSKVKKKPAGASSGPDAGGRKVHQCTFVGCLFTTKYSKDLTRHMTKHTGEKPFSCHLCGHTFGRQDKLNRHMQVHTGYKPYSCSACAYKAVDRCTLRKHMRVHTDERPYHCQICPYRSKDSSQLTVHLRTHTGDAPFACQEPECAATFKTNSDLTRHVRTHTGEKPYKCDYCDHRVKIKSNLKAHIRVNHRPNEVFKCRHESCDFVSVSRADLREHHKSHGGAVSLPEVFACTFCSFTTPNRPKLVLHMKEHDSVRPFKCSFCAYSAKSQAILSSHVNKRHGALVASKAGGKPNTKDSKTFLEKKSPKGKLRPEDNHGHNSQMVTKKERSVVLNKSICKPNFVCPVCPAGFVRRDSLRSHVKQHQREGVPIPSLIETYVGADSSRDNVIKVLNSASGRQQQHVVVQQQQHVAVQQQHVAVQQQHVQVLQQHVQVQQQHVNVQQQQHVAVQQQHLAVQEQQHVTVQLAPVFTADHCQA